MLLRLNNITLTNTPTIPVNILYIFPDMSSDQIEHQHVAPAILKRPQSDDISQSNLQTHADRHKGPILDNMGCHVQTEARQNQQHTCKRAAALLVDIVIVGWWVVAGTWAGGESAASNSAVFRVGGAMSRM